MTLKLLATGCKGQVVTALRRLCEAEGVALVCVGRPDVDLANLTDFESVLRAHEPDAVVNAAAWTAVDLAETNVAEAYALNCVAAGRISAAAAQAGLPVIQISTDYVFAGDRPDAYREDDVPGPASIYGASKLAGERAVAAANPQHVILRTSWVYSATGQNFLKTMLRVGRERDVVRVVADQTGAPTHADIVADGVLRVARAICEPCAAADLFGVFHLTAAGEASWRDFACAIFEESASLGGPLPEVEAIATADYPTPARRPANSRLDCSKIARTHGVRPQHWREAVAATVARVLRGD